MARFFHMISHNLASLFLPDHKDIKFNERGNNESKKKRSSACRIMFSKLMGHTCNLLIAIPPFKKVHRSVTHGLILSMNGSGEIYKVKHPENFRQK